MTETAVTEAVDSPVADPGAGSPTKRPSNLVGAGILAVWLALGAYLLLASAAPHIVTFAFVMVGWVLSVMAHEFCHAAVAFAAGDHTVKAKGYLDFDPRRYGNLQTSLVVPILALALGGIGFPGGAVYLRDDLMRGRLWRAAAALAGPAATAVILLVLAAVPRLTVGAPGELWPALGLIALFQAMALILNLLPLPGFDGFNALRPFLPRSLAPAIRNFEIFAPLALLGLVFFTPAGAVLFVISVGLTVGLGIPPDAIQRGWDAFHFWR
jgi:Zn-dependent protease